MITKLPCLFETKYAKNLSYYLESLLLVTLILSQLLFKISLRGWLGWWMLLNLNLTLLNCSLGRVKPLEYNLLFIMLENY